MAAAHRELREAMQAAARDIREAMQVASAEIRAAHSEFRTEMEQQRRESGEQHRRPRGRGRKTNWWDPFLRAKPSPPPRPPRRPRKGPGSEMEPVEPRPKPTPMQGGAEAPVE